MLNGTWRLDLYDDVQISMLIWAKVEKLNLAGELLVHAEVARRLAVGEVDHVVEH